jgi:hypothetical protein
MRSRTRRRERCVSGGLGLGDRDNARRDAGRLDRTHVGQRNGEKRAIDNAADQIGKEDPRPIGHHRRAAGVPIEPRQRQECKTPGDQFEAEQYDDDQPDWED